MRAAMIMLLLLAGAANATGETSRPISEAEWRSMAQGRTLTYSIGDEVFALERYAPTGNRVELQFADGTCYSGTWTFANDLYCFDWGFEDLHCFRHIDAGGRIFVFNVVDGEDNGSVQEMTAVSDAPLACGLHMS